MNVHRGQAPENDAADEAMDDDGGSSLIYSGIFKMKVHNHNAF